MAANGYNARPMESDVKQAWKLLEQALQEHAPYYFAVLGSGASDEDIEALERDLGHDLPGDLRTFFALHSGEDRLKKVAPLFRFQTLLPAHRNGANTVFAQWKFNKDCESRAKGQVVESYGGPVRHTVRHSQWIPIATDISGNGLYCDLDPAEDGRVGQIIECNYRQSRIHVVCNSIVELVRRRAEEFARRGKISSFANIPDSEVGQAWKRFEAALQAKAPKSLAALNPPVEADDIQYFEQKTGLILPPDVRDFFLIHNGETPIDKMAEPLFYFGYLIPLIAQGEEDVLSEWGQSVEMRTGGEDESPNPDIEYDGPVRKVLHSRHWIPFAIDYSGNSLCFDLNPTPEGFVGQILECDYESQSIRVISDSIVEFLDDRTEEILEDEDDSEENDEYLEEVDEEVAEEPEKLVAPPPAHVENPHPIIDEREVLEVVVKVEGVAKRPPNSILSTQTLTAMDLEIRLLDPQVVIDAIHYFETRVVPNLPKREPLPDPRRIVAYTIYRPRPDGKALDLEPGDCEAVSSLFSSNKPVLSGSGSLSGQVPDLGVRSIHYITATQDLDDHSTLFIEITARRAK
jgi:cell wall assembly regulator SMI1